MREFLVAGNWKMNGSSVACAELVDGILEGMPLSDSVKLIICPPYLYLDKLAHKLTETSLSLGAQNVSQYGSGAYTGEISPQMLRDIGCEYVVVGHSERRAMMAESNEIVASKFKAALSEGLKPILCVGETLQEREANQTESVIDEQLNTVLDVAGVEAFETAVIAYEPIWAIGTGRTASPEQAQYVHSHIRVTISSRNKQIASAIQVLYGGSVKGDNAAGLFRMADIDGGLIGGASLKAADFLAIADAAMSLV
ncbi:triose-phosphate isomerase [Woeseiaceae bacterium]|nr:triose-phosphate isomerase [Woeseiaceae bacterium]